MSRLLRSFILITIMTAVIQVAFGQKEWEEGGEIESVEIEIVKERQITLPRADRNFEKIPPRPAEPRPVMTYDFKAMGFTAPELKVDVRPLRVKQEEMSKIYSGYASAGFGNYNSPYLEGSFTSKRNAARFYGAELYHRSFGTGPVEDELSASGNTRVNVFGKAMGNKVTSAAALRYENRFNHFYASTGAPVETRSAADILHSYHVGGLEASIENSKPSDFNAKASGGFSYLADNYSAVESKTVIALETTYKLKNERLILFRTDYRLIARKDVLAEAKPRHLVKATPGYQMAIGEKTQLTVGVNAVFENDTLSPKSFHFYPDLLMTYAATRNANAYASLRGDFEEVSLHKLSAENPWMAPNVPLAHTNKALEFQLGIRGKAGRLMSFDAGTEVARFIDLYFYDNLPADRTMFTTVYDDATRLNFYAQTGLAVAGKVQMNLRGDYYNWVMDEIAYPWHRPQYKVGLYSSWTIAGKLMTDLNVVTQGGARAFDHSLLSVVKLQAAIDVNLKLRYFWSNRFSIFADGSNLLNRKYPMFLNYQVRGLQVTAGASYCF
jgi:hypothetical protein